MRFKLISVVFCSFILAACASNAPEHERGSESNLAEISANDNDVQVAQPKDQLICKNRQITGSRFKQKTCMTAEEWRNMAHGSKTMVDNASRVGVQGNPDGG